MAKAAFRGKFQTLLAVPARPVLRSPPVTTSRTNTGHALSRDSRDDTFSWNTLARPIWALAPMEDVTDTVFRRLVREWSQRLGGAAAGPHVMFTEFARVDAARRTLEAVHARRGEKPRPNLRLLYDEAERPLIAQIWGTRPEEYRDAAAALQELGFDGIDLNMGCPVRKIRKQGACSALIGNPALAREIIAAVREGSALPLSVKTRIGLSRPITEEWCGMLLEQPIDALTVHPRTADQMSEGWADWREVGRVVRMRDHLAAARGRPGPLVLGNGDVRSLTHARRLMAQTGADGVMIGRGIFHDPLLFAREAAPDAPAWGELAAPQRLAYLAEHIHLYTATWSGPPHRRRSYEILKKFFRNYVAAGAAGSPLLDALYETHSAADALELLRQYNPY